MSLAESIPPSFSETDECGLCFERLLVPNVVADDEDEGTAGPSYVIDDVQLHCGSNGTPGHHFHWSCLQDYDESGSWDRSTCPVCGGLTLDNEDRLFAIVRNEGGVTSGFDLGEAFDEEKQDETRPLSWKKEMALLSALHQDAVADVEAFLEEGVNPNAFYEDKHVTALHLAGMSNNVAAGRLLLRYGANPNALTDTGETVLELAMKAGAADFVQLMNGLAGGHTPSHHDLEEMAS